MILESVLAFAHIMAFIMLATFMTTETALCRADWVNPKVVDRLVRMNALSLLSAAIVLATGWARTFWGVKGSSWYWAQHLLHGKIALLVAMTVLLYLARRHYLAWQGRLAQGGPLPDAAELKRARVLVMWSAHLMIVVVVLAVLLARGVGTR
ncbi:DUF2214 family protein [Comamonas flocculans]|uniref:DUF2214 family protein n=1 Tax=Comamonas flocculans TaxID=2597701 RepID=A0A5B8RW08_9BURK|nr:DUF2214 family protein [Comamonas flocculans]QEA12918.1 DUF2214 family protein [Comamonas flocculans]